MTLLPLSSRVVAILALLVGGGLAAGLQEIRVSHAQRATADVRTQFEAANRDRAEAAARAANAELAATRTADRVRKDVERETAERIASLEAAVDSLHAARAAAGRLPACASAPPGSAGADPAGPAAAGEGRAAADRSRAQADEDLRDDGDVAAEHADEYGTLLAACRDWGERTRAELERQGVVLTR